MAEYVKQHYVPQFYLKNFSKNKNNINCLDKIQLKTYSSNIKNIAQGKKFYETSNINIEHDLDNIEKNAKKDIDLLLQNKKYNLLKNQKYKFRLAFYTYIQLMRTKFVREDMYNSLMSLKEHIENKYGLDDNLENCFNTILDELEIKESHLEFIMDFDMDIFRLIFTKKWIFLDNKTELNFWTSDNPVVLCNKQGNLGLDIDHIHIFFPLSPKYCLCLIDPFNYSNFMIPQDITFDSYYKKDSPNLKKHLENYEVIIKNNMKNPGICKINDEKIIKKINSLQIKYCSRAVYSIDDEFNDSNGEIKEWIKEDIDKFNNELRTQISEIKTNLDGHLYMQKKL